MKCSAVSSDSEAMDREDDGGKKEREEGVTKTRKRTEGENKEFSKGTV